MFELTMTLEDGTVQHFADGSDAVGAAQRHQEEKAVDVREGKDPATKDVDIGEGIKAYKYGSDSASRRIVIMGGLHGDEIEGVEVVEQLITLLDKMGVPDDTLVFLIPEASPDLIARGKRNPQTIGNAADATGLARARYYGLNEDGSLISDQASIDRFPAGRLNSNRVWPTDGESPVPGINSLEDFLLDNKITDVVSVHVTETQSAGSVTPGWRVQMGDRIIPDPGSVTLARSLASKDFPYTVWPGTATEMAGESAHWGAANGIRWVDLELKRRTSGNEAKAVNALAGLVNGGSNK